MAGSPQGGSGQGRRVPIAGATTVHTVDRRLDELERPALVADHDLVNDGPTTSPLVPLVSGPAPLLAVPACVGLPCTGSTPRRACVVGRRGRLPLWFPAAIARSGPGRVPWALPAPRSGAIGPRPRWRRLPIVGLGSRSSVVCSSTTDLRRPGTCSRSAPIRLPGVAGGGPDRPADRGPGTGPAAYRGEGVARGPAELLEGGASLIDVREPGSGRS